MQRITLAIIALAAMAASGGALAAEGCFARSYSPRHLASNPNQVVQTMVVRLYRNEGRFAETRIRFRAARRIWSQTLTCHTNGVRRYQSDATMMCVVECDGGSFFVRPRGRAILLTTEGGWIVGEGGCTGHEKPFRRVTDRGARRTTFKLFPVAMEVCR